MAIKVKRTTRDVAGWRKLSSTQRAKLEQEYLNTPEGREFSKRNPLRAGNKIAWQYKLDEAVNRYYDRGGQAYTQGSKAHQAKEAQRKAVASRTTAPTVKDQTSIMMQGGGKAQQRWRSNSSSSVTPATMLTSWTSGVEGAWRGTPRKYNGSSVARQTTPRGNTPVPLRPYSNSYSRQASSTSSYNSASPSNYSGYARGNQTLEQALRGVKSHKEIAQVLRSRGIDIDSPAGQKLWLKIKKLDPRNSGKLLKTIDPKTYAYGSEYLQGQTSPKVQPGAQNVNRVPFRPNTSGATQTTVPYKPGYASTTGNLRPSPVSPASAAKNISWSGVGSTAAGALGALGAGYIQGKMLDIALETLDHINQDPYLRGGQYDHNGVWRNNYGDQNTAKFWNYRYEDDNGKTYTDFGNILKNGHLIQAPNGELQYYMGDPRQFDMPGEGGFERGMKARMAKRPLTPHQAREIWDSPYRKYIPEHLIPSIIKLKDSDGGTTEVDEGMLPGITVTAPGPRKSVPRPAPQKSIPAPQQPERVPMMPIGPGQIGPIADLEPNKNPLYNPNLGDAGIGNLPARDIDGNVPMPPMVRPTIPYLGGGIPNMREALSYYPEDYNPLVHRFDDLMFR